MDTSPVANEVKMLRRLGMLAQEANYPVLDFTRFARDIFEVDGYLRDIIVLRQNLRGAVFVYYKRYSQMQYCRRA